MSFSVLYRLRLNRTDPWIALNGTPIARSTWDGSKDPEVQADPEEAPIPSLLKRSRIDSPSTLSS